MNLARFALFSTLLLCAVSCGDSEGSDSPSSGGSSGKGGSTGKGGESSAGETGSGEAGASAGQSGAGDAGAGGGGGMAALPEPWDPDTLEWEALPNLAEGDALAAGQVSIATSNTGDIFLSASFATGQWQPPYSQRVYQLVEGAWELLSGAPLEETTVLPINHGLAVAANGDVYSSYVSNVPHLLRFDGVAWNVVTVDADAPDLTIGLIMSDDSGRIVAAGLTQDEVVVYRLEGSTWARVGDAIAPGTSAPDFTSGLAAHGDEIATAFSGDLYWFRDDAWNDLGPFHDAGAMLPGFPTLAFEPDGNLLTSWREDGVNGTVLYASRWAPDAPEFELLGGELDFDPALAPSYSQLAVNAASQIFCTWRQSTVFVGYHVDGEWLPFIGDGDVAAHTSGGTLPDIALTPDGLPVVAWEGIHEDDLLVGASRAVMK